MIKKLFYQISGSICLGGAAGIYSGMRWVGVLVMIGIFYLTLPNEAK